MLPWYVNILIIKNGMCWLLFFKVNVVSFNTEASTYGGSDVTSCFSERLAIAVPKNKRSLEKYIDGFTARRKLWVFFTTIVFYHGKPPSLRSSRFRPVSFRPSAASKKDARGNKAAKKKRKEKMFPFLSRPSPSRSFFPLSSFCACPSRPKGNGNDFYSAYKLP